MSKQIKLGTFTLSAHAFRRYIERKSPDEYKKVEFLTTGLIEYFGCGNFDNVFLMVFELTRKPRYNDLLHFLTVKTDTAHEVLPADESVALRYEVTNGFKPTEYYRKDNTLYIVRENVIVTVIVGGLDKLFVRK